MKSKSAARRSPITGRLKWSSMQGKKKYRRPEAIRMRPKMRFARGGRTGVRSKGKR